MTDLELMKQLIKLGKENNIKFFKCGALELEFFAHIPEPMSLAPQDLAKVLSDSLPPDSAMLFASSEDMPTNEEMGPLYTESKE